MSQSAAPSPFHRGEREAQLRAGVRDRSERIGQRLIRGDLPGKHKAFYSQLPFVLLGALDSQGRPWASVLMGRPGFIDAVDADTLNINARLVFGDPLPGHLGEGSEIGLLGIDYQNRRRIRLNGQVIEITDQSIRLRIDQSFVNCPQYIQSRGFELLAGIDAIGEPRNIREIQYLDSRSKEIVATADHFFIASYYSGEAGDGRQGADVSHRGGMPGFVRIEDDTTLVFPDYAGNNFFNTIGNIVANPLAGLLFIDFEAGDLLYLTCRAEIIWDSEEKQAFVGAERLVKLTLDDGVLVENAVPIRWSFQSYSPSLRSTGSWEDVSTRLATGPEKAG